MTNNVSSTFAGSHATSIQNERRQEPARDTEAVKKLLALTKDIGDGKFQKKEAAYKQLEDSTKIISKYLPSEEKTKLDNLLSKLKTASGSEVKQYAGELDELTRKITKTVPSSILAAQGAYDISTEYARLGEYPLDGAAMRKPVEDFLRNEIKPILDQLHKDANLRTLFNDLNNIPHSQWKAGDVAFFVGFMEKDLEHMSPHRTNTPNEITRNQEQAARLMHRFLPHSRV